MADGFERYKRDLDELVLQGARITVALAREFKSAKDVQTNLPEEELKNLPLPNVAYEQWYSEALALIVQLLPERAEDFRSYYRPKGARKDLRWSNYTMSDYLRGTTVRSYGEEVVGPSAALPPMHQQLNILQSVDKRFRSSLFDIKTIVHAELLDDELHAAEELNKNGYARAAGAVAGVVLEAHLAAVCERHVITPKKKNPTIADLLDALKANGTVDTATWRFIQHLGDIRNKCDHKKTTDPTKTEVADLIDGVRKITKTLF